MKHSVFLISAFILVITTIIHPQQLLKIQYQGQDAVKDELIIKFKKYAGITAQSDVSNVRASILKNKKAVVKKIFFTGAEHWQISTDNIESLIQELKNNPDVEYAEPNYIFHASMVPNDQYLNNCWAVNGTTPADIGAFKAWDITTGNDTIVVGILDSGIDYQHEDLKANIWTNKNEIPNNKIDDDHNGYVDDVHGWNFVKNNNDPMDDYYHGTHVAGIAGAKGNNSIGIPGVAWKVKLAALKFLDSTGGGTTDGAIPAFDYCIKNNIKIVNCSWGGPIYIQALYDAISRANQAGVLVIAAAGNQGADIDKPASSQYPAAYDLPNIISVAANDKQGNLWQFSNYGKNNVDLSAPGVDIFSCTPGNTYKYLSGTSMAAPFVAGAVALMKSVYPTKTPVEIKSLLLSSVDPRTSLAQKTVSGGSLNIYKPLIGASIVNVTLSDKELNFGGVILNSTTMPQKKFTVLNTSAVSTVIDTIKSEKGFLISNGGGVFSEVIANTKVEANQTLEFLVKADPQEERSYDGSIRLKISSGNIVKEVKCRMTALSKGTLITSADVSGSWTKAMSPIIINDPVKVPQGQKLDVGPGTEVVFFNNAGISSSSEDLTSEFNIRAVGSKQDSIYFKSFDPAAPWGGFTISGRGKYIFEYCNFLNASKPAAGQTNGNGGAILCSGPDLRIENSGFFGNRASGEGGALWYNGGNVFIDSSRFNSNDASSGAALFLQGKENWLMNSQFRDNKCMQGIVKIKGADAVPDSLEKGFIYSCSFMNNQSANGGNMIDASGISKIIYKNCLVSGNIGSQRIISLNSISAAVISNCTLYENGTGGDGAALMTTNVGECVLENSILWNNFTNEIYLSTPGYGKFIPSYNSIKNYSGGTGNVSTVPDFLTDGSFRLSANSVLRNNGNPLTVYNDKDGSRNDIGFEGGNELVFYPIRIEFGKTGLINAPMKTASAECVSFYRDAIPVQSWSVSSDAFSAPLIPGQILPFKENKILAGFSPKQVKSYLDTLYINSGFTPANNIQILLSGVCEEINALGGSISGELKNVNGGVYHVISDLLVPKDSSLAIQAGVSLLFQPDTKLTIEGDLEVKGTPEQKVVFSSEEDTPYAGTVTFRSYNTKNILLENLVVKKMLGFNIQSITHKVVFNNCEFSNNNAHELNSSFLNIQSSTAEFNACRFTRNAAEGPVLYSLSGKLFMSNCIISRNTSQRAYILLDNSVTNISSSSVFNNIAPSGIMLRTDPERGAFKDSCTIVNSIISDNLIASAKYEIALMSRSMTEPAENPNVKIYLKTSYSCIKGGKTKLFVPAGSKLDSNYTMWKDPILADTTGKLASNSPCINAGVNAIFPVEDLSGNYRIWNSRIDMGAYEYRSKKYSPVPETPGLYFPINQALVKYDVTIRWAPVPGAVKYYLQVSDTSTFATTGFSDSTLTDISKNLSLNTSTRYYWRVMAKNTVNWGQWSEAGSFRTFMASPSAPVLKKPDNNSLNQPLALSLYWGKLKSAEKYQLQISANSNFSSLKDFSSLQVNDSSVVDTLKQITGLSNNAVYYWRVRAVNQGGVSDWSEEWTFKTLPPLPAMPRLMRPASNSKDNGVALKLLWKKDPLAESYRFTISEDDSFKNIRLADSTVRDTVKEVKELKEGMKYFWKVSSKNAAGESPSSEVWNFTTILNAPDSLEAKVISWNELKLSWKDKSNGEAGFIIERKQSADFIVIDTVDADAQSFTDVTVQKDSSYLYRVRSYTPYAQSAFINSVLVMITGVNEHDLIPKDYSLLQNYPNPFNPATVIKYGLSSESHVKLSVYNSLGQLTGVYADEIQRAGYHQINFNAGRISSGVYFYLLEAKATDGSRDFRKVKKMLILK